MQSQPQAELQPPAGYHGKATSNESTQKQSQSETQQQQQTSTPAKSQQGTFTVLLFGPLSTYCNETSQLTLPAPMKMVDLFHELETLFPGVNNRVLRSCQVVIGLEYVDFDVDGAVVDVLRRLQQQRSGAMMDDTLTSGDDGGGGGGGGAAADGTRSSAAVEGDVLIQAGDEVGFVPPVSSG